MNGITLQSVEQYMYRLLPPRDAVLADMERVAEKNEVPIVGPAVGRLLYQLARFVNAGRVFEMGSAIGYSTIWWAQGLRRGGKVYYTDGSSANAAQAEGYLQKAGVRDRVEILVGNALDLIDQVEGEFDIVFNDVDKHDYPEVFRKAAGRIRVRSGHNRYPVFQQNAVFRRAVLLDDYSAPRRCCDWTTSPVRSTSDRPLWSSAQGIRTTSDSLIATSSVSRDSESHSLMMWVRNPS